MLVIIGFVAMMVTGGVVIAEEKSDSEKPILSEKKAHPDYKFKKSPGLWEKRGSLMMGKSPTKEYRSKEITQRRGKISWLKSKSKRDKVRPEYISEWRGKISWLKSKSNGEKYSKEEINHLRRLKTQMEGAVLSRD